MKVETMIGALMLIIHITVGQDKDSSKPVEGTRTLYEKPPEPSIGFEKYIDWINRNNSLKYLSDSLTSQDRVFVQFYVDTSGQVIEIDILRGIGEPYDREAIRLIKDHPYNTWDPAEQQGKKLKTPFVVPIYFVDERPLYKEKKRRKQ